MTLHISLFQIENEKDGLNFSVAAFSQNFFMTQFPKSGAVSLLFVDAQGCQMAFFQTENPTLGKFWSALQWNMLLYLFYGYTVKLWPVGIC
jgi:hypothetical protein